jgi:hypothetical protein
MSKNNNFDGRRSSGRRGRERAHGNRVVCISVRGVRRKEPDYRRYAQVVIELAKAKAEAEAQAQHEARSVRAAGSSPSSTDADNSAKHEGVV